MALPISATIRPTPSKVSHEEVSARQRVTETADSFRPNETASYTYPATPNPPSNLSQTPRKKGVEDWSVLTRTPNFIVDFIAPVKTRTGW